MMSLMILPGSCDTNGSTNIVTGPKSHIASNFNCCVLRNAMVLQMMAVASHDSNASGMVSHGQKHHTGPHFDHLNLRNAMV